MREIKFRAWSKEFNTMKTQHGIPLISLSGQMYNEGLNITDRFILMQYTGIKDKNGKEIYEGDIIHYGYYENIDKNGLELLDRPMNFKVWWEQSSCSWCANGRLVGLNGVYPFEIIGNIHENKSLIKVTDNQK